METVGHRAGEILIIRNLKTSWAACLSLGNESIFWNKNTVWAYIAQASAVMPSAGLKRYYFMNNKHSNIFPTLRSYQNWIAVL